MSKADTLFDKAFNGGKNFVTPTVIKRGFAGRFAYELSTGTGIYDEPLFGVTLIPADGSKRERESIDKSEMFFTKTDAVAYIATLE